MNTLASNNDDLKLGFAGKKDKTHYFLFFSLLNGEGES
jgi:hypothetical protein